MKVQLIHSKSSVCQEVSADSSEPFQLPWSGGNGLVELDGELISVEASSSPSVNIGRAFISHLKFCGILDGYDYTLLPLVECPYEYRCQMDFEIGFRERIHKIALEIRYFYRDPSKKEETVQLGQKELVQHILDLVAFGRNLSTMAGMKINYIYGICYVSCSVDGLEIHL